MKKPDFNSDITVPDGLVYLFGYDVVNGVKSDFIPDNNFYTPKQLEDKKKELIRQYNPYSVNLYRKEKTV
jgi:hypothetical protein